MPTPARWLPANRRHRRCAGEQNTVDSKFFYSFEYPFSSTYQLKNFKYLTQNPRSTNNVSVKKKKLGSPQYITFFFFLFRFGLVLLLSFPIQTCVLLLFWDRPRWCLLLFSRDPILCVVISGLECWVYFELSFWFGEKVRKSCNVDEGRWIWWWFWCGCERFQKWGVLSFMESGKCWWCSYCSWVLYFCKFCVIWFWKE